jgi:hypothetical protein
MPFRSAPLYHWVSTCAFAFILTALAVLISVSEWRLRERQQAQELLREATLLSVAFEQTFVTAASTTRLRSTFSRAVRMLPHETFYVQPDGTVLGEVRAQRCPEGVCDTRWLSRAGSVAQRAAANESGTITIDDYAGLAVLAAFVPIARTGGAVVVTKVPDHASVGAVVGTYAAAIVVSILAVYVLCWSTGEFAAASTGATRITGHVILHVAQLLPLASVALLIAAGDAAAGPGRELQLHDAQQSLSALTTAVDAMSDGAARAAVAALAQLGSNSTAAGGLWIEGFTTAPLWADGFDLLTAPTSSVVGDTAIIAASIGPMRQRVVYASAVLSNRAGHRVLVSAAFAATAILGFLFAVGLPRPTLGGSERARFAQAPHFVSARSPGIVGAVLLLMVAALVASASLLQLAAATQGAADAAATASEAALVACNRAVETSAYQLELVSQAAFGSAAVTLTRRATAPADTPSGLQQAAAMYFAANAARNEFETISDDLRANYSLYFTAAPVAASLVDMAGTRGIGYTAGSAAFTAEIILPTHAWRQSQTPYSGDASRIVTTAATSTTQLTAEGLAAAGTVLTAYVAEAATARLSAVRVINTVSGQQGRTVRDASIAKMDLTTASAGFADVAATVTQAFAALKSAALFAPSTSRVTLEREVAWHLSAAGYAAIVVSGIVAALLVLLHTGGRSWLPALPCLLVVVLCIVLHVAEEETKLAAERWVGMEHATLAAPWVRDFDRAVATANCDAALLLGALIGNVSLPETVARGCIAGSVDRSRDRVVMANQLTFIVYGEEPVRAAVSDRVIITDAVFTDTASSITAGCSNTNTTRVTYLMASARAQLRRAPFARNTTASRALVTAALQTLTSEAAAASCNAAATAMIANFTNMVNVELAFAMSFTVNGPTWGRVLRRYARVPYAITLPSFATLQASYETAAGEFTSRPWRGPLCPLCGWRALPLSCCTDACTSPSL